MKVGELFSHVVIMRLREGERERQRDRDRSRESERKKTLNGKKILCM